jgi:hypothetical protein
VGDDVTPLTQELDEPNGVSGSNAIPAAAASAHRSGTGAAGQEKPIATVPFVAAAPLVGVASAAEAGSSHSAGTRATRLTYTRRVDARLERQARNEGLLREVNERVHDLAEGAWPDDSGLLDFHCECGVEPYCGELVRMTGAEYDEVRAQDDRFAVVPGHENPELERVVRRTERYLVVDKRPGFEYLVADDPRGNPSS